MTTYFDNLYENILVENANKYNTLNIISGYASGFFLNKIIDDFPNLTVNLYIGMSQQGISFENHEKYLDIVKNNANIHVYYQIKGPNTHIKALEFSNENSNIAYIGSANFTENGYFENREALTETNETISEKFKEQRSLSLPCDAPNISSYIKFYIDDELVKESSPSYLIEDVSNDDENTSNITSAISSFNQQNHLQLRNSAFNYSDSYFLPIVPDQKSNNNWYKTGVNSQFSPYGSNTPYLITARLASLDEFFPSNGTFHITTFDNYKIVAELGGKFNRELQFINFDIYQYTKKLLGIKKNRLITFEDLDHFGYHYYSFKKISDNEFIMSLAKK